MLGNEHNSMGGKLVRTIGIVRAAVKIGMQNLVYNMRRLVVLERAEWLQDDATKRQSAERPPEVHPNSASKGLAPPKSEPRKREHATKRPTSAQNHDFST